jgi:hypothetical protein
MGRAPTQSNPSVHHSIFRRRTAMTQQDEIFPKDFRDALENRGITPFQVNLMTRTELLNEYLIWYGIIGWTNSIIRTLDAIDEFKKEPHDE